MLVDCCIYMMNVLKYFQDYMAGPSKSMLFTSQWAQVHLIKFSFNIDCQRCLNLIFYYICRPFLHHTYTTGCSCGHVYMHSFLNSLLLPGLRQLSVRGYPVNMRVESHPSASLIEMYSPHDQNKKLINDAF